MSDNPRIERVTVTGSATLRIKWKKGRTEDVDLTGWIATGGVRFATLKDPAVFSKAHPEHWGAAVGWDDELQIDAMHLEKIMEEQRPFGPEEAMRWQADMGISNHETAVLLDVSVSTWNAYKADGNIPTAIVMLCRAIKRDPILMHAHYRPSRARGRPARVLSEPEVRRFVGGGKSSGRRRSSTLAQ